MNQFYWEDYCKMPQMLYLWWVAGTENLSIKYASFIESINKNNIYHDYQENLCQQLVYGHNISNDVDLDCHAIYIV